MKMRKAVLISFLLFVIVNGADVMITMIGLQLGAKEGDNEMVQLMEFVGVVEALLLKFFLVVFLGLAAIYAHTKSKLDYRIFVVAFAIGIVAYIPIIYNNVRIVWSLIT